MRDGETPQGMRAGPPSKDGGTLFLPDDLRRNRAPRAKRTERPGAASAERPKLDDCDGRFRSAMTPERCDALAAAIGVTAAALDAIGVGWAAADDLKMLRASGKDWQENPPGGAYSFAERDGGGRIVGFSFRTADGRKGSPAGTVGAQRGLIIPSNLHKTSGPVLVVEGASDVAACIVLGLPAVGRPNNCGGADDLSKLLDTREVLIVGENDGKTHGAWPGRDGAKRVAERIADAQKKPGKWTLPPSDTKDVRDWLAKRVADGLNVCDAVACKAAGAELLVALKSGARNSKPEPFAKPILTCLADVESRAVTWLWPGRIPLGRPTLLVGLPGIGKSFLATDIAARVTTGTPWPDGGECPQGSVILISAEDNPSDTIRPRLDAHCADIRHVHLLSAVQHVDKGSHVERMISLADVPAIESALAQLSDCKLIVVDPIGSFLGRQTDAHRENEVRSVLAPLAKLADTYGAAVLVVAHRRKSAGSMADDLVLGSRAFTGIARSVWHLSCDGENEDRRLLLPGKNNLARKGDGLAFSIDGEPPRIYWEPEPIRMTADDGLAAESQGRERKRGPVAEVRNEAVSWLQSALAGGPRLASNVIDDWKNVHGGSESTLNRAKQILAVKAYRVEIPGPWRWRLPNDANSPICEGLGHLGNLEPSPGELGVFEDKDSKNAKLLEHGPLGAYGTPDSDEPVIAIACDGWGEL